MKEIVFTVIGIVGIGLIGAALFIWYMENVYPTVAGFWIFWGVMFIVSLIPLALLIIGKWFY